MEKMQSKLTSWKANLLSHAGRIVLAQSTLTFISFYVMQGTLLPRKVFQSTNRISCNFIWGSTEVKRKMHLVSWEKITRPKKEGGLGLLVTKPKIWPYLQSLIGGFKMKKMLFGLRYS